MTSTKRLNDPTGLKIKIKLYEVYILNLLTLQNYVYDSTNCKGTRIFKVDDFLIKIYTLT